MTEHEHVFLQSGRSPQDTAQELARVLGAGVVQAAGRSVLNRAAKADPTEILAGEVSDNSLRDPDHPVAGEESAFDQYDIAVSWWLTGRADEEALHAEVGSVFDAIIAALPWPALHVNIDGRVFSAWDVDQGRYDFPAGTLYDPSGRHLWQRYATPRPPDV